jgi:hypothetical protein
MSQPQVSPFHLPGALATLVDSDHTAENGQVYFQKEGGSVRERLFSVLVVIFMVVKRVYLDHWSV